MKKGKANFGMAGLFAFFVVSNSVAQSAAGSPSGSIIHGAGLKLVGSKKVTCSHRHVYLALGNLPNLNSNGDAVNTGSSKSDSVKYITQCDSAGNFDFANVADGSYWIVSSVEWSNTETGSDGVHVTIHQTELLAPVTVSGHQTKKVRLTDRP